MKERQLLLLGVAGGVGATAVVLVVVAGFPVPFGVVAHEQILALLDNTSAASEETGDSRRSDPDVRRVADP